MSTWIAVMLIEDDMPEPWEPDSVKETFINPGDNMDVAVVEVTEENGWAMAMLDANAELGNLG